MNDSPSRIPLPALKSYHLDLKIRSAEQGVAASPESDKSIDPSAMPAETAGPPRAAIRPVA
jgi:hypothetical protein